jgi:UDP:flavonoid glycosyltransferase YjiC (YdhE family)
MNTNSKPKNILIAPLNWGLGHATRCIPIIRALQENNYIPIIASDGIALDLLRKEFPYLKTVELPSYHIEYAKKGKILNGN